MFDAMNDLESMEQNFDNIKESEKIYKLKKYEMGLAFNLKRLAQYFGTANNPSSFKPETCLVQGENAFPCGSIGGTDSAGNAYEPECPIQ